MRIGALRGEGGCCTAGTAGCPRGWRRPGAAWLLRCKGMSHLSGFSILSRRRLLKLGLGAGGALLMGGGGLLALRGSAPPVTGLRILTEQQYRTSWSLAA